MYLKSVTYLHAIFNKIKFLTPIYQIFEKIPAFLLHVLLKSTHIRTDWYIELHMSKFLFSKNSLILYAQSVMTF